MPVSMDSTCAVEENAEVSDGQRVGLCYRHAEGSWRPEWDCAIVKLKAVDGQRVGLCYRQAEGCWRPESGTVLSSCWRLLTVRVGLCYRQAEVSFCLVPTSIACLFTIQSKFGLSHPQQQNKQTRAERKPQNKKRWTINIEHKTQYSRISWTWRGFVVLLLLLLFVFCCFLFFAVFVFCCWFDCLLRGGCGVGGWVNWSSMFFSGKVI